jgi:hypothetical protein
MPMGPVGLWEPDYPLPVRIIRPKRFPASDRETDLVIRYWPLDLLGAAAILICAYVITRNRYNNHGDRGFPVVTES